MKKTMWITAFAISMGFLETAVVVYLRELVYSGQFTFPLKSMQNYLLVTEIGREIATIIMILGIACLAGKTKNTRFAWFIYVFAIWDIFYYIFLKLLLDWPESLFTWDVLFLIPFVWIGPVLAPIILCILMIVLWAVIKYFSGKFGKVGINKFDFLLLIIGSIVNIVNFCWDNASYILNAPDGKNIELLQLNYIPRHFNWLAFALGCGIICYSIFNIHRNNLKLNPTNK